MLAERGAFVRTLPHTHQRMKAHSQTGAVKGTPTGPLPLAPGQALRVIGLPWHCHGNGDAHAARRAAGGWAVGSLAKQADWHLRAMRRKVWKPVELGDEGKTKYPEGIT